MVDKDIDQYIDKSRYDQRRQQNNFDESIVENVELIQDPYPDNDLTESEGEVEDPDENKEYDDKEHPHEYNPPRAVVDVDCNDDSGGDRTNAFEQQNPLQSNLPSSDRDN
jgi:hypothetical protein